MSKNNFRVNTLMQDSNPLDLRCVYVHNNVEHIYEAHSKLIYAAVVIDTSVDTGLTQRYCEAMKKLIKEYYHCCLQSK